MTKIKKISFFLFITLSFNSLCFSQSANSYIDIITGNSEKYVPFQKNFNPRKYDPAILKSCFITMMDDIRHQLYGCKAFINLPMLDSVALMQAEFQAAKDNLTTQNEAPFQRTAQRLKKYGFSTQGNEIVGKAKAHQGDNDYSYYDLCLELMKPLLKTSSGVPAMLSPQYTIYGFACDIDRNLRFLYISFVQGNDLTNQVFNSIASKQKDIPISKGNAGLSFYEETVCKKCAEDQTLELVYDMLYWDENGDVFLQSDDAKLVKRLLTKAGSFIVLDFIQKEQYNCRVPQVDHNKPFRGIVSKPISVDKILAANDSTVKSNMFHAKIGAIPPQIELSKEIDINILLLSDKKVVCRTLIKKKIQNLKTSDALADSLIEAQEFEKALYRLSPMLSDSTINEQALFAIVRLAAHKEKNYLSSIFTQSVQMANLRNPQKLCALLKEFSVAVLDNKEVKKVFCECR